MSVATSQQSFSSISGRKESGHVHHNSDLQRQEDHPDSVRRLPSVHDHRMVVENYEDFSDMAKKEFAQRCKRDFPKVAQALKVLDYVNRIRRNLYRHMKERAA